MARSSDSPKVVAWRRRVRRFGRSGLTVVRFCEEEGVSTASFYRWRNRLAGQGLPARNADARRTATTGVEIDTTQLAMLLGGVSLASAEKRRKRYRGTDRVITTSCHH